MKFTAFYAIRMCSQKPAHVSLCCDRFFHSEFFLQVLDSNVCISISPMTASYLALFLLIY
jgi:hypothetical protein